MTGRRLDRTTLSWLLAAIVALTTLGIGVVADGGATTNADRTFAISRSVLCPQCTGQSVAESDVAIAREIRADIAQRVDRGESDDAIRQVYVDRYGPQILLTPPSSGLSGLVWVIPVVGVAAAVAVLTYALRRPDTTGSTEVSDADRRLVDRLRSEGKA